MSSCSCNTNTSLPVGPQGATGAIGGIGAPGTPGINGLNGVVILHNNIANISTTDGAAGAFESLQSYVLPLNELSTNGDSLEIISSLSVNVTTSYSAVRLYINGSSVVPTPPSSFLIMPGTKFCLFKATISRQNATTVFIQFDVQFSGGTNYTNTGSQQLFATNIAVNNLTTLSNTIAIFGAESPALNTLTAHNLMITKLKI